MTSPPLVERIDVYTDSSGRAYDAICTDRHGTELCKLPLTYVTQTWPAADLGEAHLGMHAFRVVVHVDE